MVIQRWAGSLLIRDCETSESLRAVIVFDVMNNVMNKRVNKSLLITSREWSEVAMVEFNSVFG